ncbi:MAG: hypothetical protein U9Q07_13280 [Planctomycetota bacterium]|nr:hypothetical protein [Planctomycetota bacterium]
MMPLEKIEDVIRNVRTTTNAATDERIAAAVKAAKANSTEQRPASVRTGEAIRRIIMKSNRTKLATAATIIIAIGLGMYALTGSGTSITMAQVRQAMQDIDWVQMVCRAEDENVLVWYSFASKVQILVDDKGRIIYMDFNAGKRSIWNPGSEDIYESEIDDGKQFAGGISNIYEGLTKSINSWEAEGKYKVTREHGTYEGKKVEIWTAHRIKGEPALTRTETMTMYIDVEKKLPLVATDVKGAYGNIQQTNHVEFKYPETGPADIYEAGAPKSAQIRHDSEQ